MSDLYEYNRSLSAQDMDHVTPYSKKNWNYILDTNSGSYTNGAQTLVCFDGSSIYNAGNYIDGSDLYFSIPLVRVACYASDTAGTLIAPTANALPTTGSSSGNEFSTVFKAGYWNLVQSIEVVCNGKTVIQQSPNVNFYNNFKLLSQMTPADLIAWGPSLGVAELDSVEGYKFFGSGATGARMGNGLCNNNMFPVQLTVATTNAGVANDGHLPFLAPMGTLCYNKGLMGRAVQSAWGLSNITSSATAPNFYGVLGTLSLFSITNITNEAKNYYAGVLQTYYMTWYDTAIIRAKDICNFFDKLPLVKQLSVLFRIYFNTGTCGVNMAGYTAATGIMTMNGTNTTFANTCPIIICNNSNLGGTGIGAPASTTNFVAGLFIAKATNTSMLGVNLATSGAAHTMTACRLYFSMVSLKPELAVSYATANRAKKILFKNVLYQNATNISAGGQYSQLVQSGVTRITGVLIIPFISSSTHGITSSPSITTAFAPAISPFDTAPLTTPLSITNLQVQIGGINELMNFYSYTYENYLQQVSTYDKLTSTDLGISCGLISQQKWEQGYRYYYVDCSRYTNATALEPRNVVVQFMNNTLQIMDATIFVEYLSEVTIDCETGLIIS